MVEVSDAFKDDILIPGGITIPNMDYGVEGGPKPTQAHIWEDISEEFIQILRVPLLQEASVMLQNLVISTITMALQIRRQHTDIEALRQQYFEEQFIDTFGLFGSDRAEYNRFYFSRSQVCSVLHDKLKQKTSSSFFFFKIGVFSVCFLAAILYYYFIHLAIVGIVVLMQCTLFNDTEWLMSLKLMPVLVASCKV